MKAISNLLYTRKQKTWESNKMDFLEKLINMLKVSVFSFCL